MRINSYLIRSKSALVHRRWSIDLALVHRSCAGPSILRWSIVRWSIDSVDARMTRAPRAARGSCADHARRAPRGNHASFGKVQLKPESVRIQYCTDSVPVQIHWKTVTTIRISEISNTVPIWVPVWTEWAVMRRYKLEHARARERAARTGTASCPRGEALSRC